MRAELLPDVVTIVHPGRSADRYGNESDDWSNPTRAVVMGRLVSRSVGRMGNGEVHTTTRIATEGAWSLILQPGTPIDDTCRVEADGRLFMVEGHPIRRRTMARAHHITAMLKVVD